MSSQPANTTITVLQRVRSQRAVRIASDSIKAITGSLRPLQLVKPGTEGLQIVHNSVDTGTKDFSSLYRDGFPITVDLRAAADLNLVNTLTNISIVEIGKDKLVQDKDRSTAAGRDLFGTAAAL